jgi:hypothetical protein
MKYEIHKNVPIPGYRHNENGILMFYPFDEMEIGDCFYLPAGQTADEIAKQRNSVGNAARKRGYLVSVRHLKKEGRIGVWMRGKIEPNKIS